MAEKSEGKEDVRLGYQAAISLWASESSLVWNRLGAMVVANTIILTLIGIWFTSEIQLPLSLLLLLCGAGVFLCILWLLMTARGYAYLRYFRDSAEHLENELQGVRTVSNATNAEFGILGHAAGRTLSYLIISVFLVVYLILGILLISFDGNVGLTSSYTHRESNNDQLQIHIEPTAGLVGINTVHVQVMKKPPRHQARPTSQTPSVGPQGPPTNLRTKQVQPLRTQPRA